MGIPFYYNTILKKYSNILSSSNKYYSVCDRLFFDFNSIIHQTAKSIYDKYSINNKTQPIPDFENLVFNAIWAKVIFIIEEIVKPKELVFIAIDGLCPMAKMHQQRKRRFMNNSTNSNYITPGTSFMNNLDSFLQKQCNNKGWTFSPSNDPGEGEHKIFKYLNENPNPNGSDIIYGLDADLILLSLLHIDIYNGNITLLREMDINQPMTRFNVNELSESLQKEYSILITEYVFLCTLAGNDFVPPLSFINIKNNDIDYIISTYKNIVENTSNQICDKNGKINYDTLIKLLEILADNEDKKMLEAHERYYNFKPKQINSNLFPIINKIPKNTIPVEQSGWRLFYYHQLFPEKDDITKICNSYFEGILWVTTYYFNYDEASKLWHYPYNYSPTILDLYNYSLNCNKTNLICDDKNNQELYKQMLKNSDLQLLFVLPPTSVDLLKTERAKQIMTDIKLGCLHFYPTKFNITTYLKTYIWECVPIIPSINYKQISSILLKN